MKTLQKVQGWPTSDKATRLSKEKQDYYSNFSIAKASPSIFQSIYYTAYTARFEVFSPHLHLVQFSRSLKPDLTSV